MALLKAPKNGVTVRMYRHGHGDCFLLAFPRQSKAAKTKRDVYVLIDCGYKPGSQRFIPNESIGDIVDHVGEATGKHLDLFIVTHEHQDHVNGIWKKSKPYFQDFKIDRAWLAWTEDPNDPLAQKLRKKHRDQLLSLTEARRQLALAVGEDEPAVRRLDEFLSLEFGGEEERLNPSTLLAAAKDPRKSINKQALKLVKDKALENHGVSYLSPGGEPVPVVGSADVRAFVLGPPRSEDLLTDEDPVGEEAFPGHSSGSHGLSFSAAVAASADQPPTAPFSQQYSIATDEALTEEFFTTYYGREDDGENDENKIQAESNAPWRRIDGDWLHAADSLALKLNTGINNTSLVLAFELPKSKKVLLFVGDAQRGNWISWADQTWRDGEDEVSCRDLLERTVLYKVGHHGSHNATLAGDEASDYPNLGWMGQAQFGEEFTAMITAVNEWAMTKNNPPWRHPLPSIKEALEHKAQGRVFQIDVDRPAKPDDVPDHVWSQFTQRTELEELYFDYTILDE